MLVLLKIASTWKSLTGSMKGFVTLDRLCFMSYFEQPLNVVLPNAEGGKFALQW